MDPMFAKAMRIVLGHDTDMHPDEIEDSIESIDAEYARIMSEVLGG